MSLAEEVIFGKVKEIMASHPLKAFSLLPQFELLWTGPIPTAFIRSLSEAGSILGTNSRHFNTYFLNFLNILISKSFMNEL